MVSLRVGIRDKSFKDFFYRLGLPENYQAFFCLPRVGRDVALEIFGSAAIEGMELGDGSYTPCLTAVPMGFAPSTGPKRRCGPWRGRPSWTQSS